MVKAFLAGAALFLSGACMASGVTLVTAGDSLSQGYGMALSARLSGTGVRVVNAGRVSSGLAVRKGRDWVDELSERGRSGASLFILSFGANDAGVPLGGAAFGSPKWAELYAGKVRAAVMAAASGGARVAFVPVPKMGNVRLERLCAQVRDVSARAAAEAGAFIPDPRWTEVAARASDGVHFTMAGYETVALAGMETAWPGAVAILAQNARERPVAAKLSKRRPPSSEVASR